MAIAEWQSLVSDEHFSVYGSLTEAWASHTSFVKKDGSGPINPQAAIPSEKRSNAPPQSTTAPEAQLYKKREYTEAKLRYITHVLSENRNGLIVDVETTQAIGTTEIEAAQKMIKRRIPKRGSAGADKTYDQLAFVNELKARDIKAHVARKKTGSAVDGRTARGKGYAQSLKRHKIVEEAFG